MKSNHEPRLPEDSWPEKKVMGSWLSKLDLLSPEAPIELSPLIWIILCRNSLTPSSSSESITAVWSAYRVFFAY